MTFFEKRKLKKKINNYKNQIASVEAKRVRSQAALVEAILTNSTPSDADVDFFNKFTEQINALRDEMHKMQQLLESESKK